LKDGLGKCSGIVEKQEKNELQKSIKQAISVMASNNRTKTGLNKLHSYMIHTYSEREHLGLPEYVFFEKIDFLMEGSPLIELRVESVVLIDLFFVCLIYGSVQELFDHFVSCQSCFMCIMNY